jgi:2-aminoethylphosphonate-pyruvate transaminase
MILLNPGPVTLSERVRQALLSPDLCHREPEFFDLQDEIRARLLEVYGLGANEWAAVLLSGSGTAAVEAMIASLAPADGRLLVLENGVYGERLGRIARVHGIPVEAIHHPWAAPLDLERLADRLAAGPRITHLAVVHHETTTGRLNDLDRVAALCREHDVALLADAVSSFGAEAIAFEDWPLTACAATANKCLHGVPGIAFVIVRRASLQYAPPPRTLYLDLAAACQAQDARGTPFTPAVQSCYALREALSEFSDQGGRPARHARYRSLAEQARKGFETVGINPLLAPGDSSVVLRAYRLPPGLSYDKLHDSLKSRGFVIYAGQGGLAGSIFRISTMGEISDEDITRLIDAVAQTLDRP